MGTTEIVVREWPAENLFSETAQRQRVIGSIGDCHLNDEEIIYGLSAKPRLHLAQICGGKAFALLGISKRGERELLGMDVRRRQIQSLSERRAQMAQIAPALRRAARRTEGALGVLVISAQPAEVVAAAVRAAVQAAEVSDEDVDRATPLDIQETTKGPAVVLTDADPDDMLPVLERLAQRLDAAGLSDATLAKLPRTNPLGRDAERGVTAIKSWMVLRGQRPADRGPTVWGRKWSVNDFEPDWQVSDEDIDAALTELVDWAVSLPGKGATAAVSSSVDTFVPVPLADAYGFMRRTQDRINFTQVNSLVVTAGNVLRAVDLKSFWGLVAAGEGVRNGQSLDWHAAADTTQHVLSTAGNWCAYGHLVRGTGTPSLSILFPDGDRHIGNPMGSRFREWAELMTGGALFDAYSVMRLPSAVRDHVDAQWQVEDLAQGGILAEHPDRAAWLSGPRVDSTVLTRARGSLGNALIDRSTERLID